MNRFKIQTKKSVHKPCKSHASHDILKGIREESISASESPLFGKHKKFDKCLKTFDNREALTTEPSEDYEKIKTKTRMNLGDERVNTKDRLKRMNRCGTSLDLLKDQDKIIKLQNNLIDNLRNEISLLENGQNVETETFGDNIRKVRIEEGKEEELEGEIRKLNKCLKRKDEIIREMKVEMDISIQKKDIKISQLESAIQKIRQDESIDNSELSKLKEKCEKEITNREKAENELLKSREQLRVISEENKLLVQNYEEVRRRFFEYEKLFNSIKSTTHKISNSKYDAQNIPSFIESLSTQNKNLSEKLKFLHEKTTSTGHENDFLKSELAKSQKKIKELKLKTGYNQENDFLVQKLQKKIQKISDLKKTVSSLEKKKYSSDCKFYPIESHISAIEEELNLLKDENKVLSGKENELSSKLKSSEKARYFYQEQTIHLKEKVNNLENQLKLIESSIQELKSQNDSVPVKRF